MVGNDGEERAKAMINMRSSRSLILRPSQRSLFAPTRCSLFTQTTASVTSTSESLTVSLPCLLGFDPPLSHPCPDSRPRAPRPNRLRRVQGRIRRAQVRARPPRAGRPPRWGLVGWFRAVCLQLLTTALPAFPHSCSPHRVFPIYAPFISSCSLY